MSGVSGKAVKFDLLDFRSPAMRGFHITWIAFFLSFFAWFGIAPLMPVVRADLALTKGEIGNIIIASVSATIFARFFFGCLCDKVGPRIAYSVLLVFGSIPVMLIGISNSYETFLLFRLAIGVIGASFVITQYHTSVMFASNVVGTANATAAGWGNMGGGATLIVMPLIFAGFIGAGYVPENAWRYSMVVPGAALFVMGFAYYFFTSDPRQDISTTDADSKPPGKNTKDNFCNAFRDPRVWTLFLCYGACFGIEITIDNIATLYFVDNFHLPLHEAGMIAGLFGMMNIFARTLGGFFGDKAGKKAGIRGRLAILSLFLMMEGLGITLFSGINSLPWAIATMLLFALFLKMSNGATYSVVPFLNRKMIGTISGIVGAGGNVGAVWAGMLFASNELSYRECLFIIGIAVSVVSVISFLISLPGRYTEKILSPDFRGEPSGEKFHAQDSGTLL